MAKSGNRDLIARMRAAPTYVSVPIGVLLVLGGTVFAFLPILGIWMAPIGLAILAPNIPGAGRLSRRMLRWSIRRGIVRIKRVERKSGQEGLPPPSDA